MCIPKIRDSRLYHIYLISSMKWPCCLKYVVLVLAFVSDAGFHMQCNRPDYLALNKFSVASQMNTQISGNKVLQVFKCIIPDLVLRH